MVHFWANASPTENSEDLGWAWFTFILSFLMNGCFWQHALVMWGKGAYGCCVQWWIWDNKPSCCGVQAWKTKEAVDFCSLLTSWASLVVQMVKDLPAMQETWVWSLGSKIPWRRAWQPTPVFLPGESPWTVEPGGLQSQRVGHMLLLWWNALTKQHPCKRKPWEPNAVGALME